MAKVSLLIALYLVFAPFKALLQNETGLSFCSSSNCEITPTNAVEEALQVTKKGLSNFGYERRSLLERELLSITKACSASSVHGNLLVLLKASRGLLIEAKFQINL